jgi:hypothetical protein
MISCGNDNLAAGYLSCYYTSIWLSHVAAVLCAVTAVIIATKGTYDTMVLALPLGATLLLYARLEASLVARLIIIASPPGADHDARPARLYQAEARDAETIARISQQLG